MKTCTEDKINLFKQLFLGLAFVTIAIFSSFYNVLAQDPLDINPNTMNAMNHGPFVSSTIAYDPRTAGSIVANKGIAVSLGGNSKAVMVFDTDLLRVASAWTDGFLYWLPDKRDGLEYWPTPGGVVQFETGKSPGWSLDGDFKDPRTWPYGPIPKKQGKYKGLYINGDRVLFSYSIGKSEVLETPGLEKIGVHDVFTRTLKMTPTDESLSLRLLQAPEKALLTIKSISNSKHYVIIQTGSYTRVVGLVGTSADTKWRIENRHLILDFPKIEEPIQFKLAIGPGQTHLKSVTL